MRGIVLKMWGTYVLGLFAGVALASGKTVIGLAFVLAVAIWLMAQTVKRNAT